MTAAKEVEENSVSAQDVRETRFEKRKKLTDPVRLADGHPEILCHLRESYHHSGLRSSNGVSYRDQEKGLRGGKREPTAPKVSLEEGRQEKERISNVVPFVFFLPSSRTREDVLDSQELSSTENGKKKVPPGFGRQKDRFVELVGFGIEDRRAEK